MARAFEYFRHMPQQDALGLLDQARRTDDPIAALVSFGRVPSSGLELAKSAIIPAETKIELELNLRNGAAYDPYEPADEKLIGAHLADSYLWKASEAWRATRESVLFYL